MDSISIFNIIIPDLFYYLLFCLGLLSIIHWLNNRALEKQRIMEEQLVWKQTEEEHIARKQRIVEEQRAATEAETIKIYKDLCKLVNQRHMALQRIQTFSNNMLPNDITILDELDRSILELMQTNE